MKRYPDLHLEMAFRDRGLAFVAGIDEAGRGAWAGPVAAGAVILPLDRHDLLQALEGVRDSKTCTPRQRAQFAERIQQTATAFGVAFASADEIDAMGIAPATRLAMRRAIESLSPPPQALLIDYVRLRELQLPQQRLPRGEDHSLSIAAASILAKVARDTLLVELDVQYPGYGFARHKGYGTLVHQGALKELGVSAVHRRSFAPVRLRLNGITEV